MQTFARVPYIVAVTGHRDCDPGNHAEMESSLRAVLDTLVRDMPHTPIYLLSGLASGADQLAAEWALSWSKSQAPFENGGPRLGLVAVLPLPIGEYVRDFENDPSGEARLRKLLDLSQFRVTVVPDDEFAGDRDAAYARLGSFLTEQAQMLIAFWDGGRTLKRGGTYHVIQKCIRTDPGAADLDLEFHRRRHLLVAPTDVDVRIVPTKRLHAVSDAPVTLSSPKAFSDPGVEAPSDYRARLDRLNAVLLQGLPEDVRQGRQSAVVGRFAAVDSLASRMKRTFLRHVMAMSVISVVAILLFQLFNFMSTAGWAALGYLVLTGSLLVWFAILRHFSSIEWMFVYARGVAEAMRVQLTWVESGLSERVSDQYMSRRSIDVSVLRALVGASTIETLADGVRHSDGVDATPAKRWIEEQRNYMRSRIGGASSKSRAAGWVHTILRAIVRFHWLIVLATVGILCVIALFFGHPRHGSGGASEAEKLLPMGFLLIGTVLFLKSGLEYHDSAVLQREDIERFKRMLPVYDKAAEMLARATNDDERRLILGALGKEAIDENAEWFVKHTDALKLPTVG